METIKNIAAIVGCILSVISLITLCSKGGRTFIKNLFKRNTEEIVQENEQQTRDIEEIKHTLNQLAIDFDAVKEVSIQDCRNTIKNIYYKYEKSKKIPLYERKTADKTYAIYHDKFHKNTYAELLYNEICKWDIDTLSYQDLESYDE